MLTYPFLRLYRPKQPTASLFWGLWVLLQLFCKSPWTRITQSREDGRRTTYIHTSNGIQAHGPSFIGRKQDTSYDTATMAMQVESARSKYIHWNISANSSQRFPLRHNVRSKSVCLKLQYKHEHYRLLVSYLWPNSQTYSSSSLWPLKHFSEYRDHFLHVVSIVRFATGWTTLGSNPVAARFSAPVQTCPGVHPTPYAMDTWSFRGVKWQGCGLNQPLLNLRRC